MSDQQDPYGHPGPPDHSQQQYPQQPGYQYGDLGDRFFGGMSGLAQGIFWSGVLLALGVWLGKQQASD